MSRTADLLDKAAEALDQGEDPFGLHFLSENEVESGECLDMAAQMAIAVRLMAWATRNPRDAARFLEAGSAGMALSVIADALSCINARSANS